MTGAYLASEPHQPLSHRLGRLRIIHYPCLIYPQSGETDHLWLMIPDLFGPDPPEADTVSVASLLQRRQAWQLVSPHRHYQLDTTASGYTFFVTEAVHRFHPGAAHHRLERPGFVVKTRMNDAAVMPCLMPGDSVFRLQHDRGMSALGKSESGCDPDDSAAHTNQAIRHC